MEEKSIDLEPRYTTKDFPGKCIKCLAEQKLDTCLRVLLRSEVEDPEQYRKYEALLAFLQSPELEELCKKSEQYLAEGKQVAVRIYLEEGRAKYELKINYRSRNNTNENRSSN